MDASPFHAPRPIVLVVDDDHLQRREIVRCLADRGIATQEADDGHAAVEAILSHMPALVIMDIKMPTLDGVRAVQALRERGIPLPKIILMTGDPDSLYRANRTRLDVFGTIEKPIPLRVLVRFVDQALARADVTTR